MLLERALQILTVHGRLKLTDSRGRVFTYEGAKPGPSTAVRLLDPKLNRKFLLNPWLSVGEAYMDGTLVLEDGSLAGLIEFLSLNGADLDTTRLVTARHWFDRHLLWMQQYNPVKRAQRNAAHHYDLSGELYDLFLDSDRQYSCAYFTSDDDTLEQAQQNKKRHIAAKLLLQEGHKVLDIGSGWGGLGLYLAELSGADVTGITLSREQQAAATERVRKAGLEDRVRFHLRDYREDTGTYDRIVSVGMFEHVGALHYRKFFAKVRDLLAEDGVMLLHSIFRMESPGTTNPWVRKYIFPGGYTPALSEVTAAIEHEGLYVTDMEVLRLHYAKTLAHWFERFQANRDKAAEIYDERFCRMWEWYLKGCEMSFHHWNQSVFQIQIAKRQEAVPLTRDYITDWERAEDTEDGEKTGRPVIAA